MQSLEVSPPDKVSLAALWFSLSQPFTFTLTLERPLRLPIEVAFAIQRFEEVKLIYLNASGYSK